VKGGRQNVWKLLCMTFSFWFPSSLLFFTVHVMFQSFGLCCFMFLRTQWCELGSLIKDVFLGNVIDKWNLFCTCLVCRHVSSNCCNLPTDSASEQIIKISMCFGAELMSDFAFQVRWLLALMFVKHTIFMRTRQIWTQWDNTSVRNSNTISKCQILACAQEHPDCSTAQLCLCIFLFIAWGGH